MLPVIRLRRVCRAQWGGALDGGFFPMKRSADGPMVASTMRLPIRSETEAFRLLFAAVAVIAVSVLLGVLLGPWLGVVGFVLATTLGAIAYLRADNPDQGTPLADAEFEPHPHGPRAGTQRVLVVANQTLAGDELYERILQPNAKPVEVDVLAPVLTSELHHVMSGIDKELAAARTRLDRSLEWAHEHNIPARGAVGDAN